VTNLVVIRIIDQTVFSINEDPVESSTVDDTLGKWCRGVSARKRRNEREKVDVREPEPKSGLSFGQLCL